MHGPGSAEDQRADGDGMVTQAAAEEIRCRGLHSLEGEDPQDIVNRNPCAKPMCCPVPPSCPLLSDRS